jgi:hypothetical protein
MSATATDPRMDDVQLAIETTAAIERAMVCATVILTTVENRPLRAGDVRALERAGMAGWEVDIFRIVRDESLSPTMRAKAMKIWIEKRALVAEQARKMAHALVRKD